MAKKLVHQCCICKAICLEPSRSMNPSAWAPHSCTISASHGICPSCMPRELDKVRRALRQLEALKLAS